MSKIIADLKNYLKSCLAFKKYDEYKPLDQVSSVVADHLMKCKSFSNEKVFIAWFAMREVLLKKLKDVPTNGDVIRTMMEYPDEFIKCFDKKYGHLPINMVDSMWAYEWLDESADRRSRIYKIVRIAEGFKEQLDKYDIDVSNIPCKITGYLVNDEDEEDCEPEFDVYVMTDHEVIDEIITSLRDSLTSGEWSHSMYVNGYAYSMFTWVSKLCRQYEYNDRIVQCVYAMVLYILEYGYDPSKLINYINEYKFWNNHEILYKMIYCNDYYRNGRTGKRPCIDIKETAVVEITRNCEFYGGYINRDNISDIDFPECIMPCDDDDDDVNGIHVLKNSLCTILDVVFDVIEDRHREQKKYTDAKIDNIVASLNKLKENLIHESSK